MSAWYKKALATTIGNPKPKRPVGVGLLTRSTFKHICEIEFKNIGKLGIS